MHKRVNIIVAFGIFYLLEVRPCRAVWSDESKVQKEDSRPPESASLLPEHEQQQLAKA